MCDYVSKELKEKPLECINNSELNNDYEIYQIFKWSAFKENYLLTIEKNSNEITLVKKEFYNGSYDRKTGKKLEERFKIIKKRKLNKNEFLKFKKIIDESDLWKKINYEVESMCTDGSGIIIHAMRKGQMNKLSNGNCSGENEYLNNLYSKIVESLNIK